LNWHNVKENIEKNRRESSFCSGHIMRIIRTIFIRCHAAVQTILSRSASRNSRKFQGHHGTSRTHENSTCVEFLEAPLRTYIHARAHTIRGSRQRFAVFLIRSYLLPFYTLPIWFLCSVARKINVYKNYIFRFDAFRYAPWPCLLFKIAFITKRRKGGKEIISIIWLVYSTGINSFFK